VASIDEGEPPRDPMLLLPEAGVDEYAVDLRQTEVARLASGRKALTAWRISQWEATRHEALNQSARS
jgi:hypothetical protein